MKVEQIAAQLYTLRNFLQTPGDIRGSFEKLHQIGYKAVQLSGLGPIEDAELLQYAKEFDLEICATHASGETLFNDPQAVIAKQKALHCTRTAYPWPHIRPATRLGAVAIAKKLNAAAELLNKEGIELAYHNHGIEFQKFDGEFMLDIYYREAPALTAELDTYWVQTGGQDPAKWIRKMAHRGTMLHLKDYGIQDGKPVMRAIGDGNLDWDGIIAAAEESGIRYFIVEQDDAYGKCPFNELKRSFDFLTSRYVK